MKNLIKKLILASIALASGNAYSNSSPIGWIHDVEVFRVVVVFNGGVNVRVTPELEGCTSPSGYGPRYASVLPEHPGLEKIYSALLTAQVSGTKVSLYLSDDKCTVGEIVVGGRF